METSGLSHCPTCGQEYYSALVCGCTRHSCVSSTCFGEAVRPTVVVSEDTVISPSHPRPKQAAAHDDPYWETLNINKSIP